MMAPCLILIMMMVMGGRNIVTAHHISRFIMAVVMVMGIDGDGAAK
jgi:hypothetical protein